MHTRFTPAVAAALVSLAPLALAQRSSPDGDPLTEVVDGSLHAAAAIQRSLSAPGAGAQLGPAACATPVEELLPSTVAPEGDTPVAVAFTPDGAKIVVAHRSSRNLVVFDANTRVVLDVIALSGEPNDVAVSSDGIHAVTANLFADTASIVDLNTGSELTTVAVGDQPAVVCVTPNGLTAVVGNTVSQSVSVIDIATATETHRIPGTGFTATVSLTPESGVVTYAASRLACVDDQTVIHPDFLADEIDFFDLVSGTVTSVASDQDPRGVAVAPAVSRAVVSHTGSVRRVSIVDTGSQTILGTVATGIDLREHIALRPDGTKAVASVQNAAIVVDLVAATVSPSLSTASFNGLATTADGLHALGIGFRGSLISYATEAVVAELNNQVNAYAGAVSPVGQRAALLANHNGEDLLVVNTNGAAGFLEDQVPSGPPPDGDKPRRVAVSVDGSTAVTTNILSDNASLIDLESGTVALVDVGNRPADVALTPDGTKAVVANLDSTFVSVIDVAAQSVTNVTTSTRNSEVEISPDGQFAYVAVVVADGVWRVNLNTLAVQGPKLPTGQMGATIAFYQETSGLTLSHDGATLVACNSFDDTITVIATATWTVVATVPVGDFPLRATFAADDTELYVSNLTSDDISVVQNAGAASAVTATIPVGNGPYKMAADGNRLFVVNGFDDTVGLVDLGLGVMTNTAPLPETPLGVHLNAAGTCLYVPSGTFSVSIGPGPATSIGMAGFFTVVDAATMTVSSELTTDAPPTQLAFESCDGFGVVPAHFVDEVSRFFAVDPASTGVYGCGVNPAGSLTLLDGGPVLGSTFTVGVDNPLGTQSAGALPLVFVALAPDPAFPCGTSLPGFGMSGPGALGEILISLAPPNPIEIVIGPPWAGPGSPAPVPLAVPEDCGLIGQSAFVQGALFDPTSAVPIGVTEALRTDFGP